MIKRLRKVFYIIFIYEIYKFFAIIYDSIDITKYAHRLRYEFIKK